MTPAVIAFQQNPATGYLYSLTIDGLDVIRQVDPSSIRVTEAGPGAVSSMGFTIRDPSRLVTIADNARIGMWDYTRDLPVFAGWVESQSPSPAYGGQGRDIEVTAYGREALLDQVIVPSLTITPTDVGGDTTKPAINGMDFMQVVAGAAPVRAFGGSGASSQSRPTAWPNDGTASYLGANVVVAGQTVRQCLDLWLERDVLTDTLPGGSLVISMTVDFYGGLRLFSDVARPSDYVTLTVGEAASGTAAADLRWTRDTAPGQVVTAVYVNGGNAAGTGWEPGNTSGGRVEAYISDSSITSADLRRAAARAILNRKGTGSGRGSLRLENFTPINAHPGGPLTITNTALGWSSKAFVISQIDKTFLLSGKQDWTVSFFDANDVPSAGGPSLARLIRSITRTLS